MDYVIAHTAPRTIIPHITGSYLNDLDRELTGFLDWVYHEISFAHWYFGYFHENRQINEKIKLAFLYLMS